MDMDCKELQSKEEAVEFRLAVERLGVAMELLVADTTLSPNLVVQRVVDL